MPRLPLDDVWSDEATSPPWLIPQIMIEGQMVILAADAGVGKTLLSCVWSISLACGLPVIDGEIAPPMRVLYMNEENSWHDIRQYLRWARYGLEHQYGPIDGALLSENLRFEQMSLSLSSGRWYNTLGILSEEHKPRFTVIDTATPACAIVDEDKNGEASVAIGHLRRAMNSSAPGCGMLVLKHAKVFKKIDGRQHVSREEAHSIRGAKAWRGATDGMIFHTKTAGAKRTDGLHSSYLWPDKARAFGLRERLKITPQYVSYKEDKKGGILLSVLKAPLQT